jgi:hypothetical protein
MIRVTGVDRRFGTYITLEDLWYCSQPPNEFHRVAQKSVSYTMSRSVTLVYSLFECLVYIRQAISLVAEEVVYQDLGSFIGGELAAILDPREGCR